MANDQKIDDSIDAGDTLAADGQGLAATESRGGLNAKKIVLFIVLPLTILIGTGVGAYFMGYLDSVLPHKQLNCTTVKEGDEDYAACLLQLAKSGETGPGIFVDIPDMVVNLSSTSRQPRFLKIALKVELEKVEDQKIFELVMPRVIDQFQTYLRELRVDDLKGSSGMYRMKIELLNRVRAATPEIKVRDVLFQEMLIQ